MNTEYGNKGYARTGIGQERLDNIDHVNDIWYISNARLLPMSPYCTFGIHDNLERVIVHDKADVLASLHFLCVWFAICTVTISISGSRPSS